VALLRVGRLRQYGTGGGCAAVAITLDAYSHAISALQEEAAERIAGLLIG
jgi:hypothetical protein